jgi:hypothetical protein
MRVLYGDRFSVAQLLVDVLPPGRLKPQAVDNASLARLVHFLSVLGLNGLKLNGQKLDGDFIDSCFLLE